MASSALRPLGVWLATWAAMLFILIVIGGTTRLTGSGLSITEWRPVSGVLPPLGEAAWVREFERYRAIPQYQQVNRGMSLEAFKKIYFWEFTHRFWARLVGVAFLIPFAVFFWRGMIPRAMRGRLALLILLLGLQGALGWFMVQSGLSERTSVSQYRLAAHLAAALLIYGATVWIAADMLAPAARTLSGRQHRLRRRGILLVGMVSATAIAGAFVAGLRAGHAYNTFPLMGGRIIPDGYGRLTPWLRNLTENVPAVQFNHRVLALTTLVLIVITWAGFRAAELPRAARRALHATLVLALAQVGLGIVTLVRVVPVTLGVLHQAGAVILLTSVLLLLHGLQREAASA